MLFSFFNGKQYDFSSFFTTFVLQKTMQIKKALPSKHKQQ